MDGVVKLSQAVL